MIKSFAMPQPLMDELMAFFLANQGTGDRRTQINEAVKHLMNAGLLDASQIEPQGGGPDQVFFYVRLSAKGAQFLQVMFDLDLEMSWQSPKTDGLVDRPAMPGPMSLQDRDGRGFDLGKEVLGRIFSGRDQSHDEAVDPPLVGSDGPDGA